MSPKRTMTLAGLTLFVAPGRAYAAGDIDVAATVSVITGAGSLLLCAMMLVVVVQLRRVAEGSAIADHITYVVGASLTLVTAVLLGWVDRFLNGFSGGWVRAGADVLTMVCVLLLATYFARVRRSLVTFLERVPSREVLAAANGADAEEESVA